MATELIWLGHGTWEIAAEGGRVVLDPFLDDNPVAAKTADQVEADYILISHGHYDHMADAEKIARRTGATIIGCYEICEYFRRRGIERVCPMNIGGTCQQPFGRVKMTPAWHSSTLPDGTPGGAAAGFLLFLPEGNAYFACDTALMQDMTLIGRVGLEIAVLPIGDNFTMGPEDALEAVRLLKPRRVVPVHVNTWPVIQQDVQSWAQQVQRETQTEVILLQPGQSLRLA
jgi:L-ascorbate metabolism protein UlaG (beta-lactamase superfamily)